MATNQVYNVQWNDTTFVQAVRTEKSVVMTALSMAQGLKPGTSATDLQALIDPFKMFVFDLLDSAKAYKDSRNPACLALLAVSNTAPVYQGQEPITRNAIIQLLPELLQLYNAAEDLIGVESMSLHTATLQDTITWAGRRRAEWERIFASFQIDWANESVKIHVDDYMANKCDTDSADDIIAADSVLFGPSLAYTGMTLYGFWEKYYSNMLQ